MDASFRVGRKITDVTLPISANVSGGGDSVVVTISLRDIDKDLGRLAMTPGQTRRLIVELENSLAWALAEQKRWKNG